MRLIDISLQKFGRLTALCLVKNKVDNHTMWRCICDCGNYKDVRYQVLTRGSGKSCGCLNKELIGNRRRTHARTKTTEYKSWSGMISRCTNSSITGYENYGGRGITVCARWRNSFELFLEDMGDKPSNKHSIDRIDVNGNYDPENCRWADREIQSQNKRLLKTNKSGVSGVSWDKSKSKWVAQISINSNPTRLGKFENIEDAIKARKAAESEYWKKEAN